MELTFRQARLGDIAEVAHLVNRAYRPGNEQGWTHEAKLVEGHRTSEEQIRALMDAGSDILLMHQNERLVTCVQVQYTDRSCNIGMLATEPSLQARGLGTQMLAHAEAFVSTRPHIATFRMSVLASRPELLAYYKRRGYVLTGESAPYPREGGVGTPRDPMLRILFLEKPK